MDITVPISRRLVVASFLVFQLLSIFSLSSSFPPLDNYSLDCGSGTSAPTILDDRRLFVSDSSVLSASSRTISVADASTANPSEMTIASPLYRTARILQGMSTYEFEIKKEGPHVIRLHFFPFTASGFNLSDARFDVTAGGFVLVSNFGGSRIPETPIVKEYFMWLKSDKLELSFMPVCSKSFAFINAIEVVSLPEDLIPDVARVVKSNGVQKVNGISKKAMETFVRINVGGPKITPYNDTLFRTWLPDSEFGTQNVPSRTVHFSSRIMYPKFGASRQVAPDSVYNTARVIDGGNVSDSNSKLSWVFNVNPGYAYLIRMHFCDIASLALNELYFNIYVNGNSAYEDFDLSEATGQVLASPHYVDFLVNVESSGLLNISIGNSKISNPLWIKALLNGLEIMKISNSYGSLDGQLPARLVIGNSQHTSGFVEFTRSVICGVAFIILLCLVVMLFLSLMSETRSPRGWIRLPTDVP